jgi:hypothetical protein
MTSMCFESKTMRLAIKSTPLILRFTIGHNYLVGISPPGELTIIWHLSKDMGILYFSTYATDMKECDVLESNTTIAEVALTRNISRTTSRASWVGAGVVEDG